MAELEFDPTQVLFGCAWQTATCFNSLLPHLSLEWRFEGQYLASQLPYTEVEM